MCFDIGKEMPQQSNNLLKFPVGSRVNHNFAGPATVTGAPTVGPGGVIELPVKFDDIRSDGSTGYYAKNFTFVSPAPKAAWIVAEPYIAPTSPLETRTNQLINELYHDRARLEKELQAAKGLADDSVEAITDLLTVTFPVDGDVTLSQEWVDVMISAAKLRHFADQ